jgi:type II secretory pathway pseudopilin PulG
MNWTVIIIVGIVLVALIVFLVRRNAKDENEFEEQQNNDYHKVKDEEGDVDTDEKTK